MVRCLSMLLAVTAAILVLSSCTGEKAGTILTELPEKVLKIPGGVQTPPGSPIIIMNTLSRNSSTGTYLSIFRDGSVISVFEGQTREDHGRPGFRFWNTGKLDAGQLDSLIRMFRDNLSELQDTYRYPSYGNVETGLYTGDMDTFLKYSYQGDSKVVRAYDYLSMYSSYWHGIYAGMPSPLAEICAELNRISVETRQVLKQNIP